MTNAAARQILTRGSKCGEIWRSETLKMSQNERLLARSRFVGSTDFLNEVKSVLLKNNRRGLLRCVELLQLRRLMNPVDAMRILAVTPEKKTGDKSRRPDFEQEVAALTEIGVVRWAEALVLRWTKENEKIQSEVNALSQRLRQDAVLCRILCDTLTRQNILGWHQGEMPSIEKPYTLFSGQVFSAYSFSYLAPLKYSKKGEAKPQPTPALIDCWGEVVSIHHIQSFQDRLLRVSEAASEKRRILPVFAAIGFSHEAWQLAKQSGYLVVNVSQLLGQTAIETISTIEALISKVSYVDGEEIESRASRIADMMDALKENPIVTSLRSIGFEIMAGLALRSLSHEGVCIGKLVPWKETERDIDAFGFQGDNLTVIECKANVRDNCPRDYEIRKFFTESVPALKKWLRTQRTINRCKAELWTTGTVTSEAQQLVEALQPKKGNDKYSIRSLREMQQEFPVSIRNRIMQLGDAISLGGSNE
ncbi:MAG: hypothetical protein KDA91_24205 [Planctomycetaceae bacterium]|nr:hypothetical protein [Planctomycetaceae bacterium]